MKILYYDCFSGISGDMNLGALLDLGVSSDSLINGLKKLNIHGWKLEITRDQRHGISGTKVTVVTEDENLHDHTHDHEHDHDHKNTHGHEHDHDHQHTHSHEHDHDHQHTHSHEHDHDHEHNHDHENKHDHEHSHSHEHDNEQPGNANADHHIHRNLADIEKIITNSTLSSEVSGLAMKIFRHVAEAESVIHDKPLHEVHFHEVGAIDSIIDIVGAAICLDALGADKVYVSTIELGSGMVKCQHGLLPVPAPATARIISGYPVHTGGVDFEATTPTGAAIIAAIAEPLPRDTVFTIKGSGYGIGHKINPSRPNILRVYLAETVSQEEPGHQAFLVECNVDDMNPEVSGYIMSRLFAAGAGDVWFTPVIMKKGRPAFTVSIICEEEQKEAIREILFTESTTIGLRVTPFTKETLHREFEEIDTHFGKVVIKKSYFNNRLVSLKPEADRCAAIAHATGLPMKQIIHEVTALALKQT